MSKVLKLVWLLIIIACIVYGYWMFDKLPQEIAIGWKETGEPKDWAGKTLFFQLSLIIGGILNMMCYAFSTSLLKKIPESILNLPWKDYWFATPQKKQLAYEKLQIIMINTGILFNSIALLLLHSIFQYNTQTSSTINIPIMASICIILAAITVYIGSLFYMMKPKKEHIE